MIFKYYPYTLKLRAPVIMTHGAGEHGCASTLSHITGSAIRGAMAQALGDPDGDPDRLREFRTLLLSADVRYLNAYPTDCRRRCLPTPSSFRIRRGQSSSDTLEVVDLAAFASRSGVGTSNDDWPRDAQALLPYPYLSIFSAQPQGVIPSLRGRTHHQRDRRVGRAWREQHGGREIPHGAPFTYEYLESDQEFLGFVQVLGSSEHECSSRFDRVRHVLSQEPLLLGRSRRAGYGGDATMEWGKPVDREVTGEGVIAGGIAAGVMFRVLLTSACLTRDPVTGQLDPTALPQELIGRLGGRAEHVSTVWTFDVVGGFNRKRRMEAPQGLVAAAGSVFLLRAIDTIPLDDILRVEHQGLGERLSEGLGRVAFLAGPTRELTVRTLRSPEPQRPEGDAPSFVRVVQRRVLQAATRRVIEQEATFIARDAKQIPSASLLERLRVPLRGERSSGLATLRTWLNGGSAALRPHAREQLERCHVMVVGSSSTLITWIRRLVEEESERGWSELGRVLRMESLASRHHVVSEDSARADLRDMSEELRLDLLDTTLGALARRRRRETTRNV